MLLRRKPVYDRYLDIWTELMNAKIPDLPDLADLADLAELYIEMMRREPIRYLAFSSSILLKHVL